MSPSNFCLVSLSFFLNKSHHQKCLSLLSLFLKSSFLQTTSVRLCPHYFIKVTNDLLLAKAHVCLLDFSVGILLNFSAAWDTVEHSVLFKTLFSWASRTSHWFFSSFSTCFVSPGLLSFVVSSPPSNSLPQWFFQSLYLIFFLKLKSIYGNSKIYSIQQDKINKV